MVSGQRSQTEEVKEKEELSLDYSLQNPNQTVGRREGIGCASDPMAARL